ncbi:hypothetical protein N799_02905 [Lysobacter arseniciresistens ZS79]|uniref:Uncharacterized protein n=1 Tax=Lysobacter arseniciresistens ZS79 TaxID=913325 RepID=A0A0A0F5L8_9GAMM|nr:hypothetical protein [Lysobacter arseniciresistens]KGM56677.1 hypothetical protein N799_02905 [Lysobacter arseniciresistens ZS79]
MNTHIDDDAFDRLARDCHAQALQQLSAPTRRRLREARQAPRATATGWRGWLFGGSGVAVAIAVAALAITLDQPSKTATVPANARLAATTLDPAEQASRQASVDSEVDEILAALDEDPGLYLWLAANDDTLPPPAGR